MNKKLLVINGSPRRKGTSFSFSRTTKMQAQALGCDAEVIHIIDYFDGQKPFIEAAEKIAQSGTLALIAPLYVDTLPYTNIWFLEKLMKEHKDVFKDQTMFGVGQCGFPDVTRMIPLLNTCRMFAEDAGLTWVGGLGYGGGAALDGKLLEDLGKNGENITQGLRLAVESAFSGSPIPDQAQELLTLKLPKWANRLLALYLNHASKKKARQYGTDVRRKVYLEEA